MPESNKFWIIWREGGPWNPKVKHSTLASAAEAALDQAKLHGRGIHFNVMELVGSAHADGNPKKGVILQPIIETPHN